MENNETSNVTTETFNTNSKARRVIRSLSNLFKYCFYLFIFGFMIYILWYVSVFIYDRTIAPNAEEVGTLDYFETIVKKEPFNTYKLPSIRIDLQPKTKQEIGALVSMGIVIAFNAENKALAAEIKKREMQIHDVIRNLIIRKVYRDLQNTERLNELKIEIKNSINSILLNGEVADIYFENFNVVPRP